MSELGEQLGGFWSASCFCSHQLLPGRDCWVKQSNWKPSFQLGPSWNDIGLMEQEAWVSSLLCSKWVQMSRPFWVLLSSCKMEGWHMQMLVCVQHLLLGVGAFMSHKATDLHLCSGSHSHSPFQFNLLGEVTNVWIQLGSYPGLLMSCCVVQRGTHFCAAL